MRYREDVGNQSGKTTYVVRLKIPIIEFQGGNIMQSPFVSRVVSAFFASVAMFALCVSPAQAVFINEIHYDNAGADTGEAVELAGAAGLDLGGWSLVLYNGSASSGSAYASQALAGVFTDDQNGIGVLGFSFTSLQNGAPDGIALVDDGGSVVQFLSYEGSFTATSGVAAGLTSLDIGVAEDSATPLGYSLQLAGLGREYADFFWTSAAASSFGSINGDQSFAPMLSTMPPPATPVPAPAGLWLLLLGMLALRLLKGASQRPPASVVAG
jgi:hypothetical protein